MNARYKRGFTLIEVMVTLIIFAFGMLASIVGIAAALDQSMMNEMRNEALKIAQEQVEQARNLPYASISTTINATQAITRQVRKSLVPYTVNFTSQVISPGAGVGVTVVTFTVNWNFKKLPQFKYVLQTIVRQV